MKLNVYAMIGKSKNIDLYLKGIYKTDNLNVRSFKMYGDGAWVLAVLVQNRIQTGQYGALLAPISGLKMLPNKLQLQSFN
jgi:hypothetical protein